MKVLLFTAIHTQATKKEEKTLICCSRWCASTGRRDPRTYSSTSTAPSPLFIPPPRHPPPTSLSPCHRRPPPGAGPRSRLASDASPRRRPPSPSPIPSPPAGSLSPLRIWGGQGAMQARGGTGHGAVQELREMSAAALGSVGGGRPVAPGASGAAVAGAGGAAAALLVDGGRLHGVATGGKRGGLVAARFMAWRQEARVAAANGSGGGRRWR
uniref:Uncharacterized protein n=1 Tax=Setaria viridis TaxID=4556 RepID=A0A4U6VHL4_SETVI|nr:hypothetical protein SEVIR_3G306800v2 [Setaria viridis]